MPRPAARSRLPSRSSAGAFAYGLYGLHRRVRLTPTSVLTSDAKSRMTTPPPATNKSEKHHWKTLAARAPTEVAANRHVFWENVVRDMLTGLSVELGRARAEQNKADEAPNDAQGVPMYDGRVAVLTTLGARIPIADVQPMLACSIATSDAQRALSAEVQCTVFQIRTPAGEVFTLPLHQISCVHVLSAELLEQIEKANSSHTQEGEGESKPFGYSAFTELYHDPEATLEDDPETDETPSEA